MTKSVEQVIGVMVRRRNTGRLRGFFTRQLDFPGSIYLELRLRLVHKGEFVFKSWRLSMPPDSTFGVLARLVSEHGRAYAPRYAIAFVFMGVVAGTTAASAWVMRDVINVIFVDRRGDALYWLPALIAAIFFAKGFAAYFQEVTLARIGNRLVAEIQKRMFDHMLAMDIGFFQRVPTNDLLTRITQNASAARSMLNTVAVGLGRDVLTLIGLAGVMVLQDPIMAGICLIGGPLAAWGLRNLIARVKAITRDEFFSMTMIVGAVKETCQGIKTVKSFQLEEQMRARMEKGVHAVESRANRIVAIKASVNPLIETAGGLAVAAVVFYAGWRSLSFGATPGEFFAFITALLLAADPARRLSRTQVELATSAIGVKMMYDLLDMPAPERRDSALPPIVMKRGDIEFRDVTYTYDGVTPVLNRLSFTAPGGKVTALVGESGCGKSTALGLLQALIDPAGGKILIDGQDIAAVSRASVRANVACLAQDAFVFEGSIRDNVVPARSMAGEEEIVEALRRAQLQAFIASLPAGEGAAIGELGGGLSGGQRQRVCLARTILKAAPIILLDEPTSALDGHTEALITEAVISLPDSPTVLIVAHRLTTIIQAHHIVMLEGGRAVASGTHKSLMQNSLPYRRLFKAQSDITSYAS